MRLLGGPILLQRACAAALTTRNNWACLPNYSALGPARSSCLATKQNKQFNNSKYNSRNISCLQSFSSSSFQPAEPPGTKGVPVFDDVDTSKTNNLAQERWQDPETVVVVSGASRGIGLQMVKTLTEHCKGTILACCRNPLAAEQLQTHISTTITASRIKTIQLDLESQTSIEQAASTIKDLSNGRVDVLINVAGLLGNGSTDTGPERSIDRIQRSWLEKSLSVNVMGPLLFTQQLVPLMRQARKSERVSLVVNFSARVGSITDNGIGGWYSYRISKSALNQATRTMAIELKRHRIWCVAVHPGTTNTDLSKPFQKNVAADRLFPVDFTVESLLRVMDGLEEKHTGGFYDWAGKAISF